MAIATDISVAVNGDIRYTGTTANYTVLELHRFLQDLADDASASGDDLLDITGTNPSTRSTDQIITLNSPFNIDDTLAQHLYSGSITQGVGGSTVYSGLKVIGSVNSASTELQIVQNGALLTNYWGTGLNVEDGTLLRILVKSRSGGADIDGKRIRVQARELGDTYAEFNVTLGQGENVAAIQTQADLNNETSAGTISGWTSIDNIEGYQTIDLNNGSGPQPYYSQWNKGTQSLNDLYERAKWITRRGTSETIHGINGELFRGITHEFDYDNEATGPFQENEIVSWGTGVTAGTGLLLALLDSGTTGTMWIQLLTGVAPSNDIEITGDTSSATADVNGAVTSRPIPSTFLGSSTGANIIGAFGIGIEATDVGSSDKLTDLDGDLMVPPNTQTFTVSNLVSGEDRVLVAANDGSNEIDYNQLTLDTTLSGATETSVVVTAAIPNDTPSSGTIRIQTDNGTYKPVAYTSWTGSTFTIVSTDFTVNSATAANNVFISYIDETASGTSASFTTTYIGDRSLLAQVRNGTGTIKIVPFKTPATFGSAGGSVSTIRTADI